MTKPTNTVIYSCPFVPAELIAAHGLHPGRIIPRAGAITPFSGTEGICPFVRAFVNEAVTQKKAVAIVVTTMCDQMRRACEIITAYCEIPAFLLNVPSTTGDENSTKLYIDELQRFSRFLVQVGGEEPTDEKLLEVMLARETKRMSIQASRDNLSPRQYSEAIAAFNGAEITASAENISDDSGIPLAMIGGPLFREDFALFDTIEQAGGKVVLDATETGERTMCGNFKSDLAARNPLTALANAYLAIPDASQRPDTALHAWLDERLKARSVRGILFRRSIWCDLWHGQLYHLRQKTNLPVLDMDTTGDEQTVSQRTNQRIFAFLEMLQ